MKLITELLATGETEKVEFKPSLSQLDNIMKSISAFSNAKGGMVVAGISDEGRVMGVDIGRKTMEDLAEYIKRNTDPPVFPSIEVVEIESKNTIHISVKESAEKPVFFKDKAYKRVGRTNQKISASEIRTLAKEGGKRLSWDAQLCDGITIGDIDGAKISWFVKEAKRQRGLDIQEDAPIEEVLMRLRLFNDSIFNNAAVLLFGNEPDRFFTRPEVKCIRFKGTGVTGEMIDFKVIKGNLFDQLVETERFIYNNITMAAWIEDGELQRQEKWEYPPKAIREALANAFCHREYETTSSTQVRIFDDRMEIWNPGRLPVGWTVETLRHKHESKPPNPLLIEHFFWVKYVEEVGTGTNKLIDWCREWDLPEPIFEFTGTSVIVTLRKGPVPGDIDGLDLNERQIKMIDHVVKHNSITNREFQELTGVSRRTATTDLAGLVE
ncbi:MAG: putative DNA binding domain-containing protein, partial [ANME-2 cluster archaeon]|nr:putative DNA binding domain-containing protein [ANME-2 cluster archaeon]